MSVDTLEKGLAARLEPDLAQFETNAQLWRLDVDSQVNRLRDDGAIGLDVTAQTAATNIVLAGVDAEIARFKAFASSQATRDVDLLVRLSEIALALETARRRAERALAELAEPQAPPSFKL